MNGLVRLGTIFSILTSVSVGLDGADRVDGAGKPDGNSKFVAVIGERAPALTLEHVLQAPEGTRATLDALRGKVVVLEFWSTKCSPCVYRIPWMNKLEKDFEHKDVVFIAVTDENEKTIRRFLKKRPMEGWIGLDTDKSMSEAYGIRSLPKIALIDRKGVLVGWSGPTTLVKHPGILDSILAGKKPEFIGKTPYTPTPDILADVRKELSDATGSNRKQPLCMILIRPATDHPPEYKTDLNYSTARTIRYDGLTKLTAISTFYNMSDAYILADPPLSEDEKYDIMFEWPKGDIKVGRRLLKQAMADTFGLSIHTEKRMTDVYVLTFVEGDRPVLEPQMGNAAYDKETGKVAPTRELLDRIIAGEEFFMAVGDTEALAQNLSSALGKPVIAEAELDDGFYHFDFPFHYQRPPRDDAFDVVRSAMKEKYGMLLTPARREVEMLIVSKADPG